MVIAYLRVSTEKQFLENQKEEIIQFANKKSITIDKWYEETASGCLNPKERKLSLLLKRMKAGDTLIVTEISRLSRTLLEIMNILSFCIQKEIILYSTKEGYIFQNDINSKVMGFAFGLAAEIERDLISQRTKEALARRKMEGKTLGRKVGNSPKMGILREKKQLVLRLLKEGKSHQTLAEELGVSRATIYRFIKKELE